MAVNEPIVPTPRTDAHRTPRVPDPERRRRRRPDPRAGLDRRLFEQRHVDGPVDRRVGRRPDRSRRPERRRRRPLASAAPSSAEITPNQATTLKDFKPFVPNPTAGTKPPVPNTFSYFMPECERVLQRPERRRQASRDSRKIEFTGQVISGSDPVKNIDQMNTALQKGIGGMWIQPDDSVAQGAGHPEGDPDRACAPGSAATRRRCRRWPTSTTSATSRRSARSTTSRRNLGGKATVVSFILDHIEILIPRKLGTQDALKTGGAGITLIEQELQKITADEGFQFASTMLQAHPDIHGLARPGRHRPRCRRLPQVQEAGPDDQQDPVQRAQWHGRGPRGAQDGRRRSSARSTASTTT